MNPKLNSLSKLDALCRKYSDSIKHQSKEIEIGNATRGNYYAKKYIKAFQEIVKLYGDQGREELSKFLRDPDDEVKEMTAAFLLKYKHKKSMGVLIELAKQNNLIGFEAGECIKRWEEGQWSLDA